MRIRHHAGAAAVAVLCLGWITGPARAGETVDDSFQRIPATTPSGSGHTVLGQCGGAYDEARAELEVVQSDGMSRVKIDLTHARPNTLYTVWLRVKGKDADGSFGGSPLTGGGATPLAPGSALTALWKITPPMPGSATLANGFTTDARGRGRFRTVLDFPLLGGAYPFNEMPDGVIPGAREIPVAIVNPAAPGVRGPFMIRIVSHCQDGLGHGLSPAAREAWFDWPE